MATNQVKKAFNHVKSLFPTVSILIYNNQGQWCFMDENFEALNFSNVDVSIFLLEDAVDSLKELPFIYQPN
jgi:hypothetical protein